jgi:hypothetical protein
LKAYLASLLFQPPEQLEQFGRGVPVLEQVFEPVPVPEQVFELGMVSVFELGMVLASVQVRVSKKHTDLYHRTLFL